MIHMSYGIIYYVDIKWKWKICLNIIINFKLRVSHIYKEKNVFLQQKKERMYVLI